MNLKGFLSIGGRKIISQGHRVYGTITSSRECRWIKINTKPVRADSLDGAVFPHIISFQYEVNGVSYGGSRYVSWTERCPSVNERICVYFDPANPANYAVDIS